MAWRIIEFALGLTLASAALSDVFNTVVVPGRNRSLLTVARRLLLVALPIWRWTRRRRGLAANFAPFVLVASFVIWMLLLMMAFGLMAHAFGSAFDPPLSSFPQALYMTGSGLVTLGLSETTARGPARWIVLAAGFCGLAVMTMAVTYLLEVQNVLADRDAGILKLTLPSGRPPSGLALLERYAELDLRDEVPQVLRDGRDWCARVQQSHAAHPSLIYFRSRGEEASWPAALGLLVDLALMVEFLIDAPRWRGLAVLLREEGELLTESLAQLVGLPQTSQPPSGEHIEILLSRLAQAGYPLRADPDRQGFSARRGRHAAFAASMAAHLGTVEAPLIPQTDGPQTDGPQTDGPPTDGPRTDGLNFISTQIL
jgi:hypothetical protein